MAFENRGAVAALKIPIDATQGVTGHNIRYVLGFGLAGSDPASVSPIMVSLNAEGTLMRAHAQTRVVLVVEDDCLLRSWIVGEFQSEGWHVLDTASGEEAVVLASHTPLDAVFTDIQLAGHIDGWDLAEVLRRSDPRIPIVYTSANAAQRSRLVAESRFFDKPYNAAAVITACADLVDGLFRYTDDCREGSEVGPLLERFSSKGLRDDACVVVVNGKPITFWLKAPADADHASRVAEFLEANVEELEVFAAAPGLV
jgi:CheY-like chemotaxis protein